KGNAVFFPIQAVLSFVPFQPHVYIVYICSVRKASANPGGGLWPRAKRAGGISATKLAPPPLRASYHRRPSYVLSMLAPRKFHPQRYPPELTAVASGGGSRLSRRERSETEAPGVADPNAD